MEIARDIPPHAHSYMLTPALNLNLSFLNGKSYNSKSFTSLSTYQTRIWTVGLWALNPIMLDVMDNACGVGANCKPVKPWSLTFSFLVTIQSRYSFTLFPCESEDMFWQFISSVDAQLGRSLADL